MNPPPFIIVADRGHLKAYHVERDERGSYTPRPAAHSKYGEPALRGVRKPGHQNAAMEQVPLGAGEETRASRTLANEIEDVLRDYQPHWAFAAPSEINGAIVDGLAPHLQERLAINLPHDLVNVAPTELLAHFEKTRA